jgi:hypothetical protein
MSGFIISNDTTSHTEVNYDAYITEVSRILSTIGRRAVDDKGSSLYSEIRFKEQDKWEIIDYISDAYALVERTFGKYAKLENVEVEIVASDIKFQTTELTLKCPVWVSAENLAEIYHLIKFFVIRYIVARKIEFIVPKDSERFMEGAKLYLEEAKKTFFTKPAPVKPEE